MTGGAKLKNERAFAFPVLVLKKGLVSKQKEYPKKESFGIPNKLLVAKQHRVIKQGIIASIA